MAPIKKTISAGDSRLILLALVMALMCALSETTYANTSQTPSPMQADPLWPCIGAAPWEYTLWNDDGSVKDGYPQYRPATVACEAPHRVGPWGTALVSENYPGCNVSATFSGDDPLVVMNGVIDSIRAYNSCVYLADAKSRAELNLTPIYQWGEACTDPASNAALIYPYYPPLGDPVFDPDNHGMYFAIGNITLPNSLPFCGGQVPLSSKPTASDRLFALYACPSNTNAVNFPPGVGICVPIVPPEPPDPAEINSTACQAEKNRVGESVDVSSGHQVEEATDYLGANGLSFSRSYTSGSPSHGATLPWGATIELSRVVAIKNAGAARYSGFVVVAQDGSQLAYKLQDNNTLMPVNGATQSRLALVTQATPTANALSMDSVPSGSTIYITGFALTRRDGSFEQYDYQGFLTSRTAANNSTQYITYTGTGKSRKPATLSDFTGRTLSFEYNARNQLVKLTDPAGATYLYDYSVDPDNRDKSLLNKVSYPDGTSIQYTYVSGTKNLSSIIDQNGAAYNTIQYSTIDTSKSVSSALVGGVNGFSFSYAPYGGTYQDPDVLLVDMTDSLGTTTHREYTKINGARRLTKQSQPAGSGCLAASSYATYTAAGRLSSADDFNGVRTCHISSDADAARNLDTSIIEGLSSATACGATLANYTFSDTERATTTQWHPDAALPVKVAAPGRQTQYIYNGQPDPSNGNALASCMSGILPNGKAPVVLCKSIVKATTDQTGAAGLSPAIDSSVPAMVSSFTYNANGQVLTSTDPSGAVTQFSYYASTGAGHTKGDLASMTNPKGQVTTFDVYNAHGDVLQSTAPNGLVTTMTYDTMRRLLSASAGGLTETYTYTSFGAVATVMTPNGGVTTYAYDPAHRLVSITDASGNVRSKTLDNAGGIVSETFQDSHGAVASSVTRVFDALHRVQQVTGAH